MVLSYLVLVLIWKTLWSWMKRNVSQFSQVSILLKKFIEVVDSSFGSRQTPSVQKDTLLIIWTIKHSCKKLLTVSLWLSSFSLPLAFLEKRHRFWVRLDIAVIIIYLHLLFLVVIVYLMLHSISVVKRLTAVTAEVSKNAPWCL